MNRYSIKIVTLALLFLSCQQAMAQGVLVKTTDGKIIEISAEHLQRITPVADATGAGFVISRTNGKELRVDGQTLRRIDTYEGDYQGERTVEGSEPKMVTMSQQSYIVGNMTYQVLPPMSTPREGHLLIPSKDGFVAVGGHTTGLKLVKMAEEYTDGTWSDIPQNEPHDDGYAALLHDGRILVGGGYSGDSLKGYSRPAEVFDPVAKTFTVNARTRLSRARAKAVTAGENVYVSGNWQYDLTGLPQYPPMDCYSTDTFKIVAAMEPRNRPYQLVNNKGEIIEFANTGYYGQPVPNDKNGDYWGDLYNPAQPKKMYIQPIKLFNTWKPLDLSADVHSWNYRDSLTNKYYFLTQNKKGVYGIVEYNNLTFDVYDVPSIDPETRVPMTFRGGAYVNAALSEAYFIGCSQGEQGYTLYIMTFHYTLFGRSISIGRAGPFEMNPLAASWLLLPDGRLACVGGEADGQPQASAYIFTPLHDDSSRSSNARGVSNGTVPVQSRIIECMESVVLEQPYLK